MKIARSLGHSITAFADPHPPAREAMAAIADNPAARAFSSAEDLFDERPAASVALIATQDAQHFSHTQAALLAGYDVLLEKPAACSAAEVETLTALATHLHRRLILCFVLRYTPFYLTINQFLKSGRLGSLVTISATEGVEPWHQAHSFVRGHWSRSRESTPMIVAKCCHDTDYLAWFAKAPFTRLTSYAGIHHFRPESAPPNATPRCADPCPHRNSCHFDTQRYLGDQRRWLHMIHPLADSTPDEELASWIHHSPWGRCAYHCHQDTPDHQVLAIEFANGITATLTMTAFDAGRRIRLHGTLGVLEGALGADGNPPWLEFKPHFGLPKESLPIVDTANDEYRGHGGGDFGLISSLPELLQAPIENNHAYIEGHRIAFAAAQIIDRPSPSIPH